MERNFNGFLEIVKISELVLLYRLEFKKSLLYLMVCLDFISLYKFDFFFRCYIIGVIIIIIYFIRKEKGNLIC